MEDHRQLEDRKTIERNLHDRLRSDLAGDPRYISNEKFYAVTDRNVRFTKNWLEARCSGKRVLDYCCGYGQLTMWLAGAGAEAHGIDISPVSIEVAAQEATARGLADKATFRTMDAEEMEYPDSYFDYVLVHGVLHHLDLEKAYEELARVLKPKGAVIATEALRHNLLIHAYRRRTPHLRSAWETDHILRKRDVERAKRYFGSVRVVKFFHLATILAVPFRNSRFFKHLLRVLEAIDEVLLKIPYLQWQAWMAVFILGSPTKSTPVSDGPATSSRPLDLPGSP